MNPGKGLARGKGLDPGGPLPRRRERPRRRVEWPGTPTADPPPSNPKVAARRVENEVRVIVYDRAIWEGETTARCEWCTVVVRFVDFSMHHRLPGQMGGDTRSYWHPSRIMLLCGSGTTGCHGRVESNRAAAYDLGLLVRRGPVAEDPADTCARTPVLVRGGWGPVDLLHRESRPGSVLMASLHTMQGFPALLTPAGGYEVAA